MTPVIIFSIINVIFLIIAVISLIKEEYMAAAFFFLFTLIDCVGIYDQIKYHTDYIETESVTSVVIGTDTVIENEDTLIYQIKQTKTN